MSAPLTWELIQGASKPGFIPGLKANLEYSYRDRLAQIEVPTLIVWGRNDMIVPVGDAYRYERLIGLVADALPLLVTHGYPSSVVEFLRIVGPLADPRVAEILDLAHALLADNAEHVAACCRIDARRA